MAAGAACLQPAAPVLAKLDVTPPTVTTTSLNYLPGGVVPTVLPGDAIKITFSEQMAALSLVPGINVVKGGKDAVQLVIGVPPPPGPDEFDGTPYPELVVASPDPVMADGGTGWAPASAYVLFLRTLLTDLHGNPLQTEVQIPFKTP